MIRRPLEACLLVASLAMWGGATVRFARPSSATGGAPVPVIRVPLLESAFRADSLDAARERTIATDPFRLSGTPPAVSFQSQARPVTSGTPPKPRPVLSLKAIMGGPPWQAVIDGLPGQTSASIVTPGSKFENLTIRSITRDTVFIQAPDTAWKLSFHRGTP